MKSELDRIAEIAQAESGVKIDLTDSQYKALLAFFGKKLEERKKQTCIFYDDDKWTLHNNNFTLKTCCKINSMSLVCISDIESSGLGEVVHKPLTSSEKETLLKEGVLPKKSGVKRYIEQLGFSEPFFQQGDLDVYRIEILYKGCKIYLDYNEYLDTYDYEIIVKKVEPDVDEKQVVIELLANLQITYKLSLSKRARFFFYKKSIQYV
jgi:uncharacterized protein YjbK